MSINLNNRKIQSLIKAVLALKNSKEAKSFLRDLLTSDEINEFSNRWLTAQMLSKGISYSTISNQTGLSSTTIARISKWLKKGKGGYRLMLKRLAHHHNSLPVGKGLR